MENLIISTNKYSKGKYLYEELNHTFDLRHTKFNPKKKTANAFIDKLKTRLNQYEESGIKVYSFKE